MSDEDTLIQNWIEKSRKKEYDGEDGDTNSVYIETEAHYNHYGDRGVVDYYERQTEKSRGRVHRSDYLLEVKSTSAVEQATGANEITRQYNRMRRYFYKDESRGKPESITFNLCFIPSKTTVKHVAENFELYLTLQERESTLYLPGNERPISIVTFAEAERCRNLLPIRREWNQQSIETPTDLRVALKKFPGPPVFDTVYENLVELGY